jgi:hypothetical protein
LNIAASTIDTSAHPVTADALRNSPKSRKPACAVPTETIVATPSVPSPNAARSPAALPKGKLNQALAILAEQRSSGSMAQSSKL